jgi:hypothetical protein
VTGPATVSLGDLAEITVPAGFRFVEPTGARQILMSMNNPVPQNLLGMLRPEVGGWFAIVEFADLGYVSDASSTLDANEIMKAVRANFTRQSKAQAGASAPSIGKVNWAVPPAYAAEGNRLYALDLAPYNEALATAKQRKTGGDPSSSRAQSVDQNYLTEYYHYLCRLCSQKRPARQKSGVALPKRKPPSRTERGLCTYLKSIS